MVQINGLRIGASLVSQRVHDSHVGTFIEYARLKALGLVHSLDKAKFMF